MKRTSSHTLFALLFALTASVAFLPTMVLGVCPGPLFVEPDTNENACTCVSGRAFDASAPYGMKCCGDDSLDCRRTYGNPVNLICGCDASHQNHLWIKASTDNSRLAYYVGIFDKEFLSDGTSLLGCDVYGTKKTITAHDFLCSKSGQGGWAECCPGTSCQTTTIQTKVRDGERIKIPNVGMTIPGFPSSSTSTQTSIILNQPGTYLWEVPPGVTSITTTLVGAGGGGGGGATQNSYLNQYVSNSQGGGGGAGEVKTSTLAVTSGQFLTITVGLRGSGGAGAPGNYNSGSAGSSGSASDITIGSSATTAVGGGGGSAGLAYVCAASAGGTSSGLGVGGQGGAGGVGPGGGGLCALSTAGGNSGGAAGNIGGDWYGYAGGGGGRAQIDGSVGGGGSNSGAAGNGAIGGGGGGGYGYGVGGNGGDGLIKLEWTPAPQERSSTFTIPGTYFWEVPSDVTSVNVVLIGGGAAGLYGGGSCNNGPGGESGSMIVQTISVVPGQIYSATVGDGGITYDSNGQSTSFSTLTAVGGQGQASVPTSSTGPYAGGGSGITGGTDCSPQGQVSGAGAGPYGGASSVYPFNDGSGRVGGFGGGGGSGYFPYQPAYPATIGSAGSAAQYAGAGGGGRGGRGSSGYMKLQWISRQTETPAVTYVSGGTEINTSYFCTPSGAFIQDLDNPAYQSICTEMGFRWTGTACCGDPEDEIEYYNDTNAGCWGGVEKIPVAFLNPSVIFDNKKYRGCGLNEPLRNLKNTLTTRPLIEEFQACSKDSTSTYFCSAAGYWNLTNGQSKDIPKQTPDGISSECCSTSQCWNGTKCINDQSGNAAQLNALGQYRCLQGGWQQRNQKFSPTGATGFCLEETQCLLNPLGSADNNGKPLANPEPQCINHLQFKSNNICLNGEWSTRTREVALELLRREGSGTFTLYCDSPSKILNKGGINFSSVATNLLQSNIQTPCILTKGEKTILGLVFSSPPSSSTLQVAFGTNCASDSLNDNAYHTCTAKLQRNNLTQLYLYSNQNFQSSSGAERNLLSMLVQLVQDIRSRLLGTTTPPYDIQSAYETQLQQFPVFNKLYVSEHTSGRKIFGVFRDDASLKQAAITYENFDDNICTVVQDYTTRKLEQQPASGSGIACTNEGKNYAILMQGGGPFLTFNPEAAWEDFTAKVRLQ